jgi:hypothetical protein
MVWKHNIILFRGRDRLSYDLYLWLFEANFLKYGEVFCETNHLTPSSSGISKVRI